MWLLGLQCARDVHQYVCQDKSSAHEYIEIIIYAGPSLERGRQNVGTSVFSLRRWSPAHFSSDPAHPGTPLNWARAWISSQTSISWHFSRWPHCKPPPWIAVTVTSSITRWRTRWSWQDLSLWVASRSRLPKPTRRQRGAPRRIFSCL